MINFFFFKQESTSAKSIWKHHLIVVDQHQQWIRFTLPVYVGTHISYYRVLPYFWGIALLNHVAEKSKQEEIWFCCIWLFRTKNCLFFLPDVVNWCCVFCGYESSFIHWELPHTNQTDTLIPLRHNIYSTIYRIISLYISVWSSGFFFLYIYLALAFVHLFTRFKISLSIYTTSIVQCYHIIQPLPLKQVD